MPVNLMFKLSSFGYVGGKKSRDTVPIFSFFGGLVELYSHNHIRGDSRRYLHCWLLQNKLLLRYGKLFNNLVDSVQYINHKTVLIT